MPKNPHVLILMATYNGEQFISDQIESILNQTYKNWKLVIHDDGSTDNTLDIINKYVEKYKDKIILIDDGIKCGGAKENFSHLIKIAKNSFDFDYIMFADQDDVWLPEKIKISLDVIVDLEKRYKKEIPILVHTDLVVVDKYLNVVCESFWKYQKINPIKNSLNHLLLENTVTGSTMIINKRLLALIEYIPKEALIHDWWIALVCAITNGIIYPLKQQTVLYRQHENNDLGAKLYSFSKLLFRFVREPKHFLVKRKLILNQISKICELYEGSNNFIKELNSNIKNPLKRKLFYYKNDCLGEDFLKKLGKLIFL